MSDISIVICGAAGQGIQTVEGLLVGIFKMSGYNVYATKEYMSRVRGGLNSTELRIGSQRVAAFVNRIDLLIPLNSGAIGHVKKRITDQTNILADAAIVGEGSVPYPEKLIKVAFTDIAKEIGNKLYSNVVAVGTITGFFNAEPGIAKSFLKKRFGSKGEKIVENNLTAFEKGYAIGQNLYKEGKVKLEVAKTEGVQDEILVNGNQAVGLGAIAGGCNFISAYPMSPSTGVLVFLAQNSKEFGIVVDQAEDEIAAINKTIGAWFAGARAIASTSGGGFALMTEGLSLAGIMESPLVIHIAQRPGPATGLPTRTAQEDLNLALYGGHGEFQRIIFAPGTIQQAFYLTQKAFNLADSYQVPVFVLTDQDFVDAYYNIPSLDLTGLKNEKNIVETDEDYKRYRFTKSGISLRGIPGYGTGVVRADSDEHDEYGHITEDMEFLRPEMVEKRVFKRQDLLDGIAEPPSIVGDENYKTLVVCWGSNYHVVKEAIALINKPGLAMAHFHQVFPLAAGGIDMLKKAEKVILLENNATGQFTNILKLYGDFVVPKANRFFRFTGKPYAVEEVTAILEKEAL